MAGAGHHEQRNARGQFVQGYTGNPAGRSRGSRNKLGEEFLAALASDFAAHGAEAIAECRLTNPAVYIRVVASLLPKELPTESEFSQMSDAELEELIKELRTPESAMTAGIARQLTKER